MPSVATAIAMTPSPPSTACRIRIDRPDAAHDLRARERLEAHVADLRLDPCEVRSGRQVDVEAGIAARTGVPFEERAQTVGVEGLDRLRLGGRHEEPGVAQATARPCFSKTPMIRNGAERSRRRWGGRGLAWAPGSSAAAGSRQRTISVRPTAACGVLKSERLEVVVGEKRLVLRALPESSAPSTILR